MTMIHKYNASKRLLRLLLVVVMVLGMLPMSSFTAFAADDITVIIDTGASVTLQDADVDGFYDIGTADELYAFAAAVNGGNGDINGELTADIVVNENVLDENGKLNGDSNFRVWTPIGVATNYFGSTDADYEAQTVFHGKFNGNNHTVSSLYFNDETKDYAGLFGATYGATINGVGVLDCYINGHKYVGGVVGVLGKGALENCYNTGSVLGGLCVGGVAGWAGKSSTVQNCFNTGNVSGRSDSNGGVVGRTYNKATVKNCYSTGVVVLLGAHSVGSSLNTTRGVVGDIGTNTVENCYFLENTVTMNGTVGNGSTVLAGTQAMSFAQFASGEVAYKLGSAFGQTLTGDNRQSYPVLGGEKVNVGYGSCADSETGYTNSANPSPEKPEHDWKDGVCQNGCGDTHSPHTGGSYIVSGNVIGDICTGCGATIGTATLIAEGRAYDGTPFDATVTKDGTLADTEFTVTYCCVGGCIKAGQHTASINLGELVASADFTIEKRELKLKLTDCYKEYDGTDILTRYTVELENFIFYDEGDYIMNDYLDYDDVYDDVDVDAEKLTVTLSDCVPGVYATATVSGITLTGETAGNYTLAETITDVPISDDWGDLFEIGTATVTITSLNQNVELGASLDQSSYTVEGLLQGHVLRGVVLAKNGNQINVNTEMVVITNADGADVTAYFSINTYNEGIVTETCVGHTFNTDGFCATGQCQIYEAPEVNDNGTEEDYDDYYEIANAGQLFWFAEYVNNVKNDIKAVLTDDITIPEGKEWIPIGNSYPYYSGSFDGQNHTISGLYVNQPEKDYVGLFGYVGYNPEIKNLTITNSTFIGNKYVGALAGYGEVTASNIAIGANVTVQGNSYTGGMIGYNSGTLRNCYAYSDSLVGYMYPGSGSIENCYFLSDTEDSFDGTTAMTAEQFASGEVAYRLQSGIEPGGYWDENDEWVETEAPHVWGQTIGTENYPVLKGKKVYFDESADHPYYNEKSEIISVNITWGAMSFTYTDGEWNPETHTYGDGEWRPDDDGDNVITVTNNGNVDVNVTFTYDKTVAEVEGSFTDESGSAISSPFTLATGEEKKIKLILNGKPSSTFEDTKLGTVTVSITLPEG